MSFSELLYQKEAWKQAAVPPCYSHLPSFFWFFTLPSPPALLTEPPALHYLRLALTDPIIGFVFVKAALSHTSYCPGLQQTSPCRANAAQTLLFTLLNSSCLPISLPILPTMCIVLGDAPWQVVCRRGGKHCSWNREYFSSFLPGWYHAVWQWLVRWSRIFPWEQPIISQAMRFSMAIENPAR